jgi:hypothetical protein
MLRKLVLVTALAAAPMAFAQQNVDISGANYSSGKADATLAALGRKAAASGNRLVITAPPQWHSAIATKVQAGGAADVVMRDGFYENVLVRVEDKSAELVEAEAEKKAAKADTEKAKARDEVKQAAAARTTAAKPAVPSRAPAAPQRAAPPAVAPAAPVPVAKAPPVAAAPVAAPIAKAAPAKSGADVDAIHARLEQSLIGGRSAEGSLPVSALQSGDTIHVDGPVRAVVRREGIRPLLYWLDGDLDLRRSELKVLAENRYQVVSLIRGEGSLRREFSEGAASLDVREPAADSPVRAALEKSLNDGRTITDTMTPDRLRNGDIIYSSENNAVVVRRSGNDLSRYWLVGSLDLTQVGLRTDGANKYKVVADILR